MRRWILLMLLTFIGLAAVIIFPRFSNEMMFSPSKNLPFEEYRNTPEFNVKFSKILSIMGKVRREKHPFNEQEMKFLKEMLNHPFGALRQVALTTFTEANPDPNQKEELVRIAISHPKDSEWIMRDEAVYVLGWLQAREAIPHILPLLDDPDPRVRETVQKTLQRLGYKTK